MKLFVILKISYHSSFLWVRLQVVWLSKSVLTSWRNKLVVLEFFLGGVPGVPKGKVTIIGGGVVGTHAARIALGLGAQVTILDISAKRLSVLEDVFGHQIQTLMSNPFNIEASVRDADVVIGAVLILGLKLLN